MRAAKVQASLRIRAVSPEPSLLAHTSSESRGTFRQKARSLAPLNGWACAVKVCHDGMLEDTNSLGGAQLLVRWFYEYGGMEAATRAKFYANFSLLLVIDVLAKHNNYLFTGLFQKFGRRDKIPLGAYHRGWCWHCHDTGTVTSLLTLLFLVDYAILINWTRTFCI